MATIAGTLAQTLENQARKYGSRTFLKAKHENVWRDYSWSEVAEQAARLRAGLTALGVGRGDRVAILAENGPHWVAFDMAVLGLGAVVVALYTTSGLEETRHILNDSGARVIGVYGGELVGKILALAPSVPNLETIVALHPNCAAPMTTTFRVTPIEELLARDPIPAIAGSGDDLATLIYTSGTSGPPKGAMLTHGNILANCASNRAALSLNENDLTLSFLPVAHAFERTAGYYTVVTAGAAIAYAEGLTQIAQNLLEVEPTIVLTVPRLLEVIHSRIMRNVESAPPLRRRLFALAVAAGTRAADRRHHGRRLPPHLVLEMRLFRKLVFARITRLFGRRLRYLISGGAPLPVEINRLLTAAEIPLVEGYGLTEAAPVVSVNLHGFTRIGSVGRALEGVEVRTAADGELLVRGANVMKGYYRQEGETEEIIDADGWLHTGDVGRIDTAGFITITDRKKEIIVLSGGKNISPAHLENQLTSDPLIAQACVIGDRRKHLAALLVPDFDYLQSKLAQSELVAKTPEEIVAEPQVHALYQATIRAFNKTHSDVEAIVAFELTAHGFSQENGELTPTLKLRRRVVQEHYRVVIDGLYGGG